MDDDDAELRGRLLADANEALSKVSVIRAISASQEAARLQQARIRFRRAELDSEAKALAVAEARIADLEAVLREMAAVPDSSCRFCISWRNNGVHFESCPVRRAEELLKETK